MYFDGSVTGLSVGSPVVFKGVKVGSVTNIALVAKRSHDPHHPRAHGGLTTGEDPDRCHGRRITKRDPTAK